MDQNNLSQSSRTDSVQSSNSVQSSSGKKVPLEFTAHGTTPSGKPRLFVCEACTRAFARLEHLRRHERSHTKEKPFTCGVCQRKFSRRDLLLRHAQKLHAGCADAITRLRRKSVRKTPEESLELPVDDKKEKDVNFNLNLFDSDPVHSQLQQMQQIHSQPMHSRSHSLSATNTSPNNFKKSRKNSDLSKMLMRGRGASFSAQSGQNYAANVPELNDLYSGADNVEFSTPQLAPSQSYDEPSWLNNISSIPGMNNDKDKRMDMSGLLYMMPTVTMQNDFKQSLDKDHKEDGKEFYGYSFYDIPESMTANEFNGNFKGNTLLTPIKQEFEEDHMDNPQLSYQQDLQPDLMHNSVDFDLNFMNDIGDLTNEIDVNAKFMPNGYSFYGDNPSVSSSNIDSPNHNSPNNYLNQSQLLNIENTTNLGNLKLSNFSKDKIFTPGLRNLITRSLNKYPINGILNPILPSNERLEYYVLCFKDRFLTHFPFIHPSKLNEHEIMLMTANEDFSNESSRSCLPLLVATIGALLSNDKSDSEHLYEASRRTIHIYLETRKLKNEAKNTNPLWLIQSLTLSVIYGLFSDNENNVFIVIRQLNALNSLVKTSIKEAANKKHRVYFVINKQEEENLNYTANNDSLFDSNFINEEILFNNNINLQSQSRIIFLIYRVTAFLLIYYNIPLTLSINDLNNLELPNKGDEIIWGFHGYQQYQEKKHELPYFLTDKRPVLYFKDLLLRISKNSNVVNFQNSGTLTGLGELSNFGFLTLIHGIFEINQFNPNLNTVNIVNNLTLFLKDRPLDKQVIDYSILTNFISICSIMDFKLLKQQSWLKNTGELIKQYENLINSVKLNEFSKIDKILDYSLSTLKFILVDCEKSLEEPINDLKNFQELDDVSFETLLNLTYKEETLFDQLNLFLSQSIFHLCSLLSVLVLKYLKYPICNYKLILTGKFKSILQFFQTMLEKLNIKPSYKIDLSQELNFDNILYILNIGEMVLFKIHNQKLNFAIFGKLSVNLNHIKRYLVTHESKYR